MVEQLADRQCAGAFTYFGAFAPLSEQPCHNQHQGPDGHDGNSEKQISFAYQRPTKSGTHLLFPHADVARLQVTLSSTRRHSA